jgi:NADH-quinone oxidoreductase subunit A
MVDLVGHFLLFMVVAIVFLMIPLLVGKLLRPKLPTPEKDAIYECGEPTIGTSYVQFDLRFYVVALLFIIFDVEVAFFFPWAMVYGNVVQLADPNLSESARTTITESLLGPGGTMAATAEAAAGVAHTVALFAFVDILVFFGVLLVGFAYVWKRGDLDWVRAVAEKAKRAAARPRTPAPLEPPAGQPDQEPVGV